jgi:hypothetical protein
VLLAAAAEPAGESESQAFLIKVEEGGPENRAERFQRILVISLPFSGVHSYALCYLSAAIAQHDKTPDLSEPRDYKPYMLGGAVALALAIAVYDAVHWNRPSSQPDQEQSVLSPVNLPGGSRDGRLSLLRFEMAKISF